MTTIICNTKFKLDPFYDGGSKRSVQIREILERNCYNYIDDPFLPLKDITSIRQIGLAFRAIIFIHKHYPRNLIRSISHYLRLVKYFALRIPAIYDKYINQDIVFLWENTNNTDLVYLMKATKRPIIGMPHNLESLVHRRSFECLKAEIECLSLCDIIFAISKEETWLLRLFGINAHYLPYYPPKKAEDFLLAIRNKRSGRVQSLKCRYALLGSATNPPTRIGMQRLIDYVAINKTQFDLIVAGYETDSLSIPAIPSITLLGTLSKDDLMALLIDIDGVLIYQPPSTGALTRIAEMLIAGIPVFSNFDAKRDYHNISGVNQYASFDELLTILNSFHQSTIETFAAHRPCEKVLKEFIDSVSSTK